MTGQRVAIVGAGSVGSALARALARAGRPVTVGARDPDDPEVRRLVAELGDEARVLLPAAAITEADVVVVAIPGAAMVDLIDGAAGPLAGKVVVDATNNLSPDRGADGPSALSHLAEVVPTAHGYRAFNSVGWENIADPFFDGVQADMFFAGPDGGERLSVENLIAAVGFRPQYVGAGADAHLAVDTLTTLWFALVFGRQHGRHLAFRLLTDPPGQSPS